MLKRMGRSICTTTLSTLFDCFLSFRANPEDISKRGLIFSDEFVGLLPFTHSYSELVEHIRDREQELAI